MKRQIKPTALESKILGVLWRHPASTVREVNEALEDEKNRAYTTVLTALQIMERKKLVSRKRDGIADRWTAAVEEESVARPMLRDIVQRMLGGRRKLALQYLLEEEAVTEKELDELQDLIDKARRKSK